MMNIVVCINLLLFACVSVCLTASLSDDQLAQIIGERLQTDPLTESREYASAEDINEFEKRLAALERLDEVTGKLFPDNTPTEYSDGPKNYPSANKDDNSDLSEMLMVGGHDVTRSEGKQMVSDRITHSAPDISFYCIQNSKTQEELKKCFQNGKHQNNKSKPNQMNTRDLMCVHDICVNNQPFAADNETTCNIEHKSLKDILACIKAKTLQNSERNGLFKVNAKRRPFCGRYGCRSPKRKLYKLLPNIINTFDLNCLQQHNKIEEAINCLHVDKAPKDARTINKSDQKRNPFCGRYGCGRKRSVKRFACNRYSCVRSLVLARGASDRLTKQNMVPLNRIDELKELSKRSAPELSATSEYFTIPNTDGLQLRTYKNKAPISNDDNSVDESKSFTKEVPEEFNDGIIRNLSGQCGSTNKNCIVDKIKTTKKTKVKIKKSQNKY